MSSDLLGVSLLTFAAVGGLTLCGVYLSLRARIDNLNWRIDDLKRGMPPWIQEGISYSTWRRRKKAQARP